MAIIVGDFTPSVEILDTDFISQTDDKIRTIINEAGTYLETETQLAATQLETSVDTKLSEVTNNPDFTYTADAIDAKFDAVSTVQTPLAISHTLKGTFDLSNTVTTLGFDAVTYTGQTTSVNATYYTGAGNAFAYATDTLRHGDFFWNNTGVTQTINVYDVFNAITSTVDVANNNGYLNTGISSVDFTVSGNGSGYWLDRSVNQVKTDAGAVVASGEVEVNTSKVYIKNRDASNHGVLVDGLRGANKRLKTSSTAVEVTQNYVGAFNSDGFTVNDLGTGSDINETTLKDIAYQTLYTHIKWGTTNQGKFQIEAYNPVTNEGMIYYLGSGVAGHQISHSQGVEIDYADIKNLEVVKAWISGTNAGIGNLNETVALTTPASGYVIHSDGKSTMTSTSLTNAVNQEYIMYYKCKSETFTIGTYTGTGVAGNFVETKDVNGVARKPRRVIVKATSGTGGWNFYDSERLTSGGGGTLTLDDAGGEGLADNALYISSTGFTVTELTNNRNVLGVQYIYLVEFDTNADNNGSYFDKATDTTNLQATDVYASISNGYGANGASNVIVNKVGSIIPTNNWQD